MSLVQLFLKNRLRLILANTWLTHYEPKIRSGPSDFLISETDRNFLFHETEKFRWKFFLCKAAAVSPGPLFIVSVQFFSARVSAPLLPLALHHEPTALHHLTRRYFTERSLQNKRNCISNRMTDYCEG